MVEPIPNVTFYALRREVQEVDLRNPDDLKKRDILYQGYEIFKVDEIGVVNTVYILTMTGAPELKSLAKAVMRVFQNDAQLENLENVLYERPPFLTDVKVEPKPEFNEINPEELPEDMRSRLLILGMGLACRASVRGQQLSEWRRVIIARSAD